MQTTRQHTGSESLREAYAVNLTNPQQELREAQLIAGYSDEDAARKLLIRQLDKRKTYCSCRDPRIHQTY